MLCRYLGAAAFATALIAVPDAASAQNSDGIRYDCDTAANHFSELVLPAIPAPFIVTGKVKLMTLAVSKDYVPMTQRATSPVLQMKTWLASNISSHRLPGTNRPAYRSWRS